MIGLYHTDSLSKQLLLHTCLEIKGENEILKEFHQLPVTINLTMNLCLFGITVVSFAKDEKDSQ